MWATLYTDASYKPAIGGTWAVWARSEHGRIVRSGVAPGYIGTSNEAELAAIYAGIFLILNTWSSVTAIKICSDSQVALQWVRQRGALKPGCIGRDRLLERLNEIVTARGLELLPNWVKGHRNPNDGTPQWLNHQCDKMAKSLMRELEQQRQLIKVVG